MHRNRPEWSAFDQRFVVHQHGANALNDCREFICILVTQTDCRCDAPVRHAAGIDHADGGKSGIWDIKRAVFKSVDLGYTPTDFDNGSFNLAIG